MYILKTKWIQEVERMPLGFKNELVNSCCVSKETLRIARNGKAVLNDTAKDITLGLNILFDYREDIDFYFIKVKELILKEEWIEKIKKIKYGEKKELYREMNVSLPTILTALDGKGTTLKMAKEITKGLNKYWGKLEDIYYFFNKE